MIFEQAVNEFSHGIGQLTSKAHRFEAYGHFEFKQEWHDQWDGLKDRNDWYTKAFNETTMPISASLAEQVSA